ncbi:MAG TPA: hypothetical protein VK279_00780 [Solirubrobacteraceae bacterium]|nr:hypothetical protein [Solirubrobacteraceae bacterium]
MTTQGSLGTGDVVDVAVIVGRPSWRSRSGPRRCGGGRHEQTP